MTRILGAYLNACVVPCNRDLATGSVWVGSWVIYKKGLFLFGSKRFGSEWVRVETDPGQNGFQVGPGWLKIAFFKRVVLIVCIGV
ncbi:hypothetical protein HanPSC8_Chr06g0268761 [Helianthus annuus]|nr:hypothetical protein HanPSC8_Chr06g0268761 [Helianthus annuus]